MGSSNGVRRKRSLCSRVRGQWRTIRSNRVLAFVLVAFLLAASLLLLVVSRYEYIILGDTQQQSFTMPFLRRQAHSSAAAPWDSRILHIVVTRFMQDQPTLKWLARARLKLFQYICLPTMVHQTVTTNVIWLV